MIRRLRRKFILAAMLSLLAVLSCILIPVNLFSYRSIVSDADRTLQMLSQSPTRPMERPDGMRMDMHGGWMKNTNRELPFENHFFSVTLNADGSIAETYLERIFSVDEELAAEAARNAVQTGREQGFYGTFRYLVLDNGARVFFLDCERSLTVFRNTLVSSVLVSAVGMCAVWILLVILSDRIVKPVAESDSKQRQFITDAGHEIKTPLTIINADADLIELESGESEWLDDIRRQTARLTDLTNNLIYLSRMDEDQPQLPAVEFPISDVVEEAAQSFQSLAHQQNKPLEIRIQPMLSYTGSEKDIRQLVSILLDNALKYTPEGGSISLSLRQEGKTTLLSATNETADVMNKATLERLFDRFYRAEAARSSSGYGLGLSIARSIVAAHKGRIKADSPKEKTLVITAELRE